jgi:hypothetical protein
MMTRVDTGVTLHARGELIDAELDALHASAFGHPTTATPWRRRLAAHSLDACTTS